jgi:hypothetical protein
MRAFILKYVSIYTLYIIVLHALVHTTVWDLLNLDNAGILNERFDAT